MKNFFHLLTAATLMLVSSAGTMAEEGHTLGTIQGNEIDLKAYDHAIAGALKDFVIWGAVDEANGTSELIMRKDGQIIRTTFKKQENGKFGGVIEHETEEATFKTGIFFVKMDNKENKLYLTANDQEVVVSISAEKFENGHFINPTYTARVGSKEIRYAMQGAHACYGFSAHLSMLILGAYLH